MHFSKLSLLALSAFLSPSVGSPTPTVPVGSLSKKLSGRRNVPSFVHTKLSKRGEPQTGEDFPDVEPHPNELDKVEAAFKDAILLTSYAKQFISTDNTIYPHYFAEEDRAEITRIFTSINNDDKGNDYLDKILVQKNDPDKRCDGQTLAYTADYNTDHPFIVLCWNAFAKKASSLSEMEGKKPGDADGKNFYAACKQDGGDIDQNVSYLMNTLGMTLLHEYMHMDQMIQASFGSIVDDPKNNPGYGPVNVYDNLAKDQARNNADSYAYYASQVFWTTICGHEFAAPRPGIDDQDPDCGNKVCQAAPLPTSIPNPPAPEPLPTSI